MVPLWQTVELLINSPRHQVSLARLSAKAMEIPLMTRITDLMGEVEQRLAAGRIADAYDATSRALPDARIVVQPTITAQSMHSTPNATANATLQLIVAALTADKRRVHGQVKLAGEALGIDGVCGFPIMIGREGWRLWDTECLDDFGRAAVASSADAISSFLIKSCWPQIEPRLAVCRGGGLKMRGGRRGAHTTSLTQHLRCFVWITPRAFCIAERC